VQNSASNQLFNVRNDGTLILGAFSESPSIYPSAGAVALDLNGASVVYYIRNGFGGSGRHIFSSATKTGTSGVGALIELISTFSPASGTGVYNMLNLQPTINQTGGANGITRGLYVNPTLTSAADFRAIETARGNVVFGNLPTSSAGLPSGALWNNGGVINIV
jgi:hypothetical protein